jgi:hypothetical protein
MQKKSREEVGDNMFQLLSANDKKSSSKKIEEIF